MCVYVWMMYRPDRGNGRERQCASVRVDCLHDAKAGGHGLHRLAKEGLEGLIAGHLGSLSSALSIDRGTGSLSWGRGSRRGLVLVEFEERHGW